MSSIPPGTFTLVYTPPDGYVAEEGEILEMRMRVVPGEGFSAPVSLRLDIAVPSPVLPFVILWRASYDLGTTVPPYPPVTWTLPLDPDSPPEGYEWVTNVALQAKNTGITAFYVNARVTGEGGGQRQLRIHHHMWFTSPEDLADGPSWHGHVNDSVHRG